MRAQQDAKTSIKFQFLTIATLAAVLGAGPSIPTPSTAAYTSAVDSAGPWSIPIATPLPTSASLQPNEPCLLNGCEPTRTPRASRTTPVPNNVAKSTMPSPPPPHPIGSSTSGAKQTKGRGGP